MYVLDWSSDHSGIRISNGSILTFNSLNALHLRRSYMFLTCAYTILIKDKSLEWNGIFDKGRLESGWGCTVPAENIRPRQSIPRDIDNRTTGWVPEDEHTSRSQTVERRGEWPEDVARDRPRDRKREPPRDFQSRYGFK